MAQLQFLYYHPNGTFSPTQATPPTPTANATPSRNTRYLFFDPVEFNTAAKRDSVIAVFAALPTESLIANFAAGTTLNPPPGAYSTSVRVFLNFHACMYNPHCSLSLGWVDEHGNDVETYATAHLHENGMETIFENSSGGKWIRPLGALAYEFYDYTAKV